MQYCFHLILRILFVVQLNTFVIVVNHSRFQDYKSHQSAEHLVPPSDVHGVVGVRCILPVKDPKLVVVV